MSYGSNGFGTRSIAVADVNLDGRFDLVVASLCVVGGGCLDGTVAVLLGNGEGMFQIAANYSSGGNGAESVVVADVNGDGGPDVVVANDACPSTVCGGAGVGVLLNNLTDHEAPIITISAFPNILWPPNSMMVPVAVSGNISDSGSGVKQGSPRYSVIDEYGKVQPSGPISLAPGGNYSVVVWLQASRDGSDRNGRRYSITVSATDYAGNNGSNQSSVVVPHDSARGR